MPRPKKKIHYIYKTTCLITGRYYIGMHSTNNIDDGYLGSGKRLRYSIHKHGKENHTREILEYCVDDESLALREKELVTPELITDNLCMNLKPGGLGGFNRSHQVLGSPAAAIKRKWLAENDEEWVKRRSENLSSGAKRSYESGKREKLYFYDWVGKKHKDESKRKIGIANSIRQAGEKNSQFGTCWITKDNTNRKIKCEELPKYLELGWSKGRGSNYLNSNNEDCHPIQLNSKL